MIDIDPELLGHAKETFLSLVRIPSHSLFEGEIARYCAKRLADLGMSVSVDHAGTELGGETGNVIASMDGVRHLPKILLCAHLDTVQSTDGVEPWIDDAGIVHSDGKHVLGADDKAGVSAILVALLYIERARIPHGPIEVLLTVAEEQGLEGIRRIRRADIEAEFGLSLDCDGPVGTYAVAGIGCYRFEVEYAVPWSHANMRGDSAVRSLRRGLSAFRRSRSAPDIEIDIAQFMGVERSNFDTIRAVGYIKSFDDGLLQAAIDDLRTQFTSMTNSAGSYATVSGNLLYPPYAIPDDSQVRRRVEESFRKCGMPLFPRRVTDGSDTNILCHIGVPVVNIGVGYRESHSPQEHVALSSIRDAARVVVDFVADTR